LFGTKGYVVVVVEKRHASYTYMHILFNNAKQSVAAWYGCDPIPLICEGGKKVVATCHPSWTICLHISILVGTFYLLPIQLQAAQLTSKSCIISNAIELGK
jgi:hypothetical protein